MLDINPGGKKVIVSIDGGGMRGMIAVAMLAELERLTGKTCQQLFDMAAGTSTGAIIAAGIGLGLTAQEMMDTIYAQRLPDSFRRQPRGLLLWLRYALRGLRYLYDFDPFLEALGPLAVGKKIGDFQDIVVFMTTKDLRTSNTYYIVSAGPGRQKFADWPVSGAVAASGAAPIYFPPVLGSLVDGGVGIYSNPCLAATVEAMEYIGLERGFTDDSVIHLSLGTGYKANRKPDSAGSRFWLYNWVDYIINQGLHDSALQQVFITRTLYGGRIDFRRYNPYLDSDSLRDHLGIDLTGRPAPEQLELDSYSPEAVAMMAEIGRAYARKIDWTLPGYMPWITTYGPDYGAARDGGHPLPGVQSVDWVNSPYR